MSYMTQATVGGSPFGTFISVARGHSREKPLSSYAILRILHVLQSMKLTELIRNAKVI